MSLTSFALVVVAALTHAIWNLLAKKAASVGAPFVAAYTGLATVIYAPAAVWAVARYGFPMTRLAFFCIAASGVLHLVYSLVLQRGYQLADLSVVYPVARGTGPLLSAGGAFLLLGETVTLGAVTGLVTVVFGILVLATGGHPGRLVNPEARNGVAWGGATGGFIAAYTVVDGGGAKVLGIHPVVLDWCGNALRVTLLLPAVLRDWRGSRERMRGHWALATAVGLLSPLGYILVLTAIRMGAPVHVVAPAREMSMMIGALLGMVFLRERLSAARIGGCALIVLGVVLLAS